VEKERKRKKKKKRKTNIDRKERNKPKPPFSSSKKKKCQVVLRMSVTWLPWSAEITLARNKEEEENMTWLIST